jgi:hypothetical protein
MTYPDIGKSSLRHDGNEAELEEALRETHIACR